MAFPITKIIVYKNGFAYFEREGTVVAEQQVSLEFKPTEVNDVLRSLRVADEHGGVITNVTYETTKQLITKGRAPLFIPANNSMATMFNYLQGVNVKLDNRGEAGSITGRVIGLTKKTGISIKDQAYLEIDLLTDKTITSWRVDSVGSITILDDELPNDMNAFLDYVVASKDKDTRKVNIVCSGNGKRRVTISYILQNPVWKSSYRIHMKQAVGENNNNKESEVQIEGWACVDNISDEDWNNVSLSLVSGTPISYSYDLYNPILCSHNEQYSYSSNHPMQQFQVNYKPSHIMYDNNTATGVPVGFEGNDKVPFIPPANNVFGAQNVRKKIDNNNNNNNNNNNKDDDDDDSITLNNFDVATSQFQYNIPGKIIVGGKCSTLVPTINGKVNARKVCWYNRDLHKLPLAGVLFKNMMGNTLDKGPVFVSENNKYVGEAFLQNNVAEHEWRILPYGTLPECSVITSTPSQVWIPLKLIINKGRLTGTQRLQESIEYSIKNNSGEELEFVLEHTIPSGWDFAEKLATLEVRVSDSTRRFFFKVPPHKRVKFIVKYNRENRYADVWLINMNSQTLEQLESLLTTEIGDKFVGFFESAKIVYGHRSTYIGLKQEEDAILAEQYRLHTLAQHANQHTKTSFSERLMDYEDRLTRIRESRNAAIDKWKTARSSLLESIDALQSTVDLYNKKDQKFKVPPLLPTMTIRELVAEPPDVPIQDSIFTSYGAKNYRGPEPAPSSTILSFGARRADNSLDLTGANSVATNAPFGNNNPSTGFSSATPSTMFGISTRPSGFGSTTQAFGAPAAPSSGTTTASTLPSFSFSSGPTVTASFGSTTPAASSSPFGTTATPATTTPAAFGSTAPATFSSPFGSTTPAATTSSPFGSTTPATTTSSLFGSTTTPAATTSSLFGSTTPAATTSSLFGSTTPAATTGSSFGSPAPEPTFGTAPASATTTSLFRSEPSTSSPAPPDSSSNITWSNSPRD